MGTPFVALIAALFAGLIAWRQWRTAQNRLKLDLFDRRFVIYDKTRGFLVSILASGRVERGGSARFISDTRPSKWLFNPGFATYLAELGERAWRLESLELQFEPLTDQAERESNLDKQAALKDWLADQFKALDGRFAPFLALSH